MIERMRTLKIQTSLLLMALLVIIEPSCFGAPEGNLLFQFGRPGNGPGEFVQPIGVAFSEEGRIIVVDNGSDKKSVQAFDRCGNFLFTFNGSDLVPFKFPRYVASSDDGDILISDAQDHIVHIYDSCGNPRFVIGTLGSSGNANGQFDFPSGVVVNGYGEIIVVDKFNNRVQVFDRCGNFLFKFGSSGLGFGKFASPQGVDVNCDGHIAVADTTNHLVQILDRCGNFLFQLGTPGKQGNAIGQFDQPIDVAFNEAGEIHVLDFLNFRVQVFDRCGNFLTLISFPPMPTHQRIAINEDGIVAVIDDYKNLVQVFE